MPPWAQHALLFAGCFLAGSIPCSLLVGLTRGVDIRKVGSGNVGATNLGRALGRKFFFIGFTLDMAKGLLPVLGAGWVLRTLGEPVPPMTPLLIWLGCAAAAVLGHVFTPWLGFKGGKGVATGLGALLGVFPTLTVVGAGALVIYLAVLAVWRTVSLSSVVAALCLPFILAGWFAVSLGGLGLATTWPFFLVVCAMTALVLWTHRANIARLRAGTEPRIGQRVKAG
ncbi:MAG TPA: glycerol-3-phosphate acyltransferase [Phycisphaerales bacterium]|nr:glycerol-3-phosphate acyltransferase [Phycisphaerales bacterium]